MYEFIYENENEFKQLERGVKRLNMIAYQKLLFEIYPNLKNGDLKQAKKNDNLYEIELPTDTMFSRVYGKYKLVFEIIGKNIKLIDILPREILLEHLKGNTIFYKGIIVSKNSYKDKYKIDLLSIMYK